MSLSRDNLSTAITEHSGQLQHHDVIMSHYPWWLKKTMMSGWHLTLNYPFAESVMSKTDYCQLIMKVSGQSGHLSTNERVTMLSTDQSEARRRGCFCTMYNSRDWRGDVGITGWLSGPWMTPGIWSDHVWCEHVTLSQSAVSHQLSHNVDILRSN